VEGRKSTGNSAWEKGFQRTEKETSDLFTAKRKRSTPLRGCALSGRVEKKETDHTTKSWVVHQPLEPKAFDKKTHRDKKGENASLVFGGGNSGIGVGKWLSKRNSTPRCIEKFGLKEEFDGVKIHRRRKLGRGPVIMKEGGGGQIIGGTIKTESKDKSKREE